MGENLCLYFRARKKSVSVLESLCARSQEFERNREGERGERDSGGRKVQGRYKIDREGVEVTLQDLPARAQDVRCALYKTFMGC